ncbi:kinase-like domain-containing protein [Jimgerdemannia flammicorona]|uniref:Kinase-like domain-containing protein n=1 Tax=Jimgerdemannia flammicorona TaxID=994334 RepID=A0A433Q9B9_9FUNG|nr:kinase-like domain-containing protein [Jimgerdemannia flammicorona]
MLLHVLYPSRRDHNGFTPDSIFYEPPPPDDISDTSSDGSSSAFSTGTASPPNSGSISKNSIFDAQSLAPTIPFIRSKSSRNSIFDTPPSTEPSLRPPPSPFKPRQEDAYRGHSSYNQHAGDSNTTSMSPHALDMTPGASSGLSKKNAIFWDTAVSNPPSSGTINPSASRSTIQSPSLPRQPFTSSSSSRLISPSSFSSPPAHLGPTTPPILLDPSCPTLTPPQDISLVLLPTRKNLLGVGRHAEVYKATYTTPAHPTPRVCAAKRLNANKESQTVGLSEAYILRRLMSVGGQHENIIQLIGVKDEASFQAPAATTMHSSSSPQPNDDNRPTLSVGNPSSPIEHHRHPSTFSRSDSLRSDSSSSFDPIDWSPCLVLLLEYCANGSLWDWVQANREKIGRRLWMKWARQMASAVERVHSVGLVHHDIKPHNVLLTEMLDIKLSDFGTAVFTPATHTLQDGLGKGTPPYSPPELLSSPPRLYSYPVDIFSLGVTLFVIGVTGEEPYLLIRSPIELLVWVRKGGFWEWEESLRTMAAKDSPATRRESHAGVVRYLNGEPVPQDILMLLKAMMSPRPEDRPTASEVVNTLRDLDWGEETPGLGGGEGFDWERKGDQSLFGAADEEAQPDD